MLTQLHIKNVAVIDETDIELGAGLSVLTGETGAGKSIIIDSINMIMGERGGKDLVRHGETNALIQASFETNNAEARDIAEQLGAESEDGELVLTRRISDSGKSTCRLNSALTTSSAFRELGVHLIDIHGQHDNQKLLLQSRHIEFLDNFGKNEIKNTSEDYLAVYDRYTGLSKKLEGLVNNESERLERIEFLSFRINELEQANLLPGEEDELLAEEKLLSNAEEIIKALSETYALLYDGEYTIYDALSAASKRLSDAAEFDEELKEDSSSLTDILYRIGDIASNVRMRRDMLDFDPERLSSVQERLALISSLKRKYNTDVEGILSVYSEMCIELDSLTDGGESADEVREALENTKKELDIKALALTCARQKAAKELEELVTGELSDLDMDKVCFSADITKAEKYTKNGADRVEFMISTNPGEPKKPLAKIASGGELSRIMLALKTVLADADDVETLIFDEIDTGVSGRAAGKIAAKLLKIAKRKQVICITHLAQIAAAADNHYLIKKQVTDKASSTEVELLKRDGRIDELSRIIGGITVSESAKTHACDMIFEAEELKKSL